MMARTSFGLRGMYLPLFFQVLGNIIFVSPPQRTREWRFPDIADTCIQFGLQATYGGQAISLMLGAIFPSYKDLENTLPAR
jgi:NCS1 family nucleobase:cation symporter-1